MVGGVIESCRGVTICVKGRWVSGSGRGGVKICVNGKGGHLEVIGGSSKVVGGCKNLGKMVGVKFL